MKERCFDCKFYQRMNADGGMCRRYAPRPILMGQMEAGRAASSTLQPTVSANAWCGEFVRDWKPTFPPAEPRYMEDDPREEGREG
jgi:hypothetical protein